MKTKTMKMPVRDRRKLHSTAQAGLLMSASLLALIVNAPAYAEEWRGTTSTDWNTASNWENGTVPNASTDVEINTAQGNVPVITVADAKARVVNVGATNDGAIQISGGHLTSFSVLLGGLAGSTGKASVSGSGSSLIAQAEIHIGDAGTGELTIAGGGQVQVGTDTYVGLLSGAKGTLNIADSGSFLTTGLLNIGTAGDGALNLSNGATLNSLHAIIGDLAGGKGSASATGAGTSWLNTGQFTVGGYGEAGLSIGGGADVKVDSVVIGQFDGADGSIMVSNATLSGTGAFTIGSAGDAFLAILNGGKVASAGYSTIGNQATGTGLVQIDGPMSQWSHPDKLSVGKEGQGEITVANGGLLETAGTWIGDDIGSQGLVTISGVGSAWNNSDFVVVGLFGDGKLAISNGASVINGDALIGGYTVGKGVVDVSGSGTSWTNNGEISVGRDANGRLNVSDGATVSSLYGLIAYGANSTGVANISNADWLISGDLVVGQDGDGTLNITNGGVVTNQKVTLGINPFAPASHGKVAVDGPGSKWLNNDAVIIGSGSGGEVIVSNGAQMHALGSGSTVSLGNDITGVGKLTVTGANSIANLESGLIVGNAGEGQMSVEAGGMVHTNATPVFIGAQSGSTGAVRVKGPGSMLDAVGAAIEIGYSDGSSGSLNIADGGLVSSDQGLLGVFGTNAYGEATITGLGSEWNANSKVDVGVEGAGVLTITDGGTLTVDAGFGRISLAVNAGSTGVLNIGSGGMAGTINASEILFGAGAGKVNFDHAEGAYSLATSFIGNGAINHVGSGTTILTGDSSSFMGTTDVSAGVLRVDGTLGGTTSVLSGGSLGGSGKLAGPVSLANGSTLLGASGQTLSMSSLSLADASNVNVTLGATGNNAGLFDVTGDLTLDGKLNVAAGLNYGAGVYRLFDYGGNLTNNGLDINAMPNGTTGQVQTSVANQINLVVNGSYDPGPAPAIQFWNGGTAVADGIVHGGAGTWSAGVQTNWTDANGTRVDPWSSQVAVFQNNPDSVTVDGSSGAVSVNGMQFIGDGWVVGGDGISLTAPSGSTVIRVGDGSAAGAAWTATINSELSGANKLVKDDLGTLVLTGENSYTAGTAVNAGTLQIGNGGTSGSITGDVANNGRLAFNRMDATSFAGTISGSGSVSLIGGDLSFTADHSYTGGTEIVLGTILRLGNGGTSGSVVGPIDNDGALIFNRLDDVDFGSVFTGNGQIRQAGTGRTNLTGDSSTFAGSTTVETGTLAVNGSLGGAMNVLLAGRLQGTGTVGDTVVSGAIAPGNSIGTLHIAGNISFAVGSVYEVEADAAGQADRINASGVATINGGTVKVLAGSGNYMPQTNYTILNATGGVNGTFMDVTSNLAFLDPSLSYDANNVYLRLTRNNISFGGIGMTPNQIATGSGTESLGWGNQVFDTVVNLSAEQARDAFDQLSGEIHPSVRTAMIEDSRFVRNAVWDRLRASADDDTAGLWGQAIGSWGHTADDGNAARVGRSAGGLLMGIDHPAGEDVRLGAVWGYSRTDIDVAPRGSSGKIDSFHLGAYAGGHWGAVAVRTGLSYAWHDIHTARVIAFAGFNDMARAGYNGRSFQAFGELGYGFDLGETRLEPYGSVAYVRARSDAFNEAGNDAKLAGAKATSDVTFTTLGLRSATGFKFADADAVIRLGAGWRHAFGGDAVPQTDMSYQMGGNAFRIAGVPVMRDVAGIDAGLDIAISDKTHVGIAYGGQFGSGLLDQTAKASISFKF